MSPVMMAEGYQAWWARWRELNAGASPDQIAEAAWSAGAQQAMREEGYATPSALEELNEQ